jgi:hypothetical protein
MLQCRAALQREQMLFAAIDDALGGRVNEVPHESFLPRIRDRIGQGIDKPTITEKKGAPIGVLRHDGKKDTLLLRFMAEKYPTPEIKGRVAALQRPQESYGTDEGKAVLAGGTDF